MTEYIEREAAIAFMNEVEPCICYNPDGVVYSATKDSDMLEFLRAIPAADVVPVRHGRWNGHDIGNGRLSIDEDTCSLCRSRFYQIAETGCKWSFCPNCGARMDLEATT